APFGQVAIEVDGTIVGSTTPVFVIGDSGTSSPLFEINAVGQIGIATSTIGQNSVQGIGFSIATSTYIAGGLSVGRSATTTSGSVQALAIDGTSLNVSGRLDSGFSGTNTFAGNLSAIGLNLTTGGLNLSGDILSSGKITATGAATSSIPQLVNATLLAPASLYVSGVGTSSFEGGINVKSIGGITSASGLNISGGDILSSGKLVITNVGTSSNSGTFTNTNLLSSGSLFISGAGTSTTIDANQLVKGNLTVGSGLTITGGKIESSGVLSIANVGTSTFSGQIKAGVLSSDTQLVLIGNPSCASLQTDANGVVKCTTESALNISGWTDTGTIVRLLTASDNVELGDLFVLGSDINIGNGILATSTISGQYGKLGFATTAPFGQVAIEVDGTIVGSTTPVLVIGDSGTSSPLFEINSVGQVGISTSTIGQNSVQGIGFSVATNTYISGGLSVGRSATTSSGSVQALAIDGTTLNLSSRIDSIFSG
ncbi:MAG: hypothetical protein Q8K86_03925, partial [Candidatus Nanopelagicaceae bacterium]|nr:hypothetical protein [Candidatus Nanopelagicaceae bacterium]